MRTNERRLTSFWLVDTNQSINIYIVAHHHTQNGQALRQECVFDTYLVTVPLRIILHLKEKKDFSR